MINIEQLAEKIFGIMKGFGHQIKLFTDDGTETVNPADARRFFSAESGLMVTIDEDGNEVQLSKSNSEPLDNTKKLQRNMKKLANEFLMNYTVRNYGKSIEPRDFSYKAKIKRNQNMAENRDINEISDEMKQRYHDTGMDRHHKEMGSPRINAKRAHDAATSLHKSAGRSIFNRDAKIQKAQTDVDSAKITLDREDSREKSRGKWLNKTRNSLEKKRANENKGHSMKEGISRLTGSKKTSHQTLENVRILVKHKTAIDEEIRGSRSRNIHSVFLEQNGERFRFPHNHLGGARAMARHMSMGGNMQDKVGGYIIENVGSLIQLAEFLRYAKTNKLVNEDTSDIIETVRENISTVKTELHRLAGIKTYESIKTRIEEQEELTLQENDMDSLRDMFTVKKFDEKFDGVLPVVSRLIQEKDQYLRRIEESASTHIVITNPKTTMSSILEFTSDASRFGHKLSDVAARIIENSELASFVSEAGRKLYRGGELSPFERDVVSNVLENLRLEEKSEYVEELQESRIHERFYDKYTYLFV